MMVFRTLCLVFLVLANGCYSQLKVCGRVTQSNKIVGGQNASSGSWPWQVSLQVCGRHFCGGSLINNGWVLSAAHCFERYTASEVTVKVGLQTLEGNNSDSSSSSLTKIYIHPEYNLITYDNDIALLQLSSALSISPYITPVCVAAAGSTFKNGILTWVTGWGNIRVGVSLPSPGILQEVQVPIVENRECICSYGSINDNMLCAGLLNGGKDSCAGDSGGPLVIKQGSQWIQVGIVSFGNNCAFQNYPGVYVRASRYQNWIQDKITTNQPGFINYTSNGPDMDLQMTCTPVPSVVCGYVKSKNFSGAGSPLASAGTWPWMASLQLNSTHICGGTLIAQQFVMSSTDCFSSSSNPSDWTVILGRLHQNNSNPKEVSVAVTKIIFSNNIALLKLSTTATLSNFIQPICMNLRNTIFSTGTQCWAAGWGSGGGAQQTLQQFKTTIVDCGNVSSSNSICIEPAPLEQTERGGPLMCKIGQSWIQAAVLTLTSNSISSTTSSTNSSNSSTNSTNSSKRFIKFTNSSNSTINSTFPCTTSIQSFPTISSFSDFLMSTVGSFPPPATSTYTSYASYSSSSSRKGLSSLLIALLLLMSLLALRQTFGSE